jgi:hypothetical protein
MSKRFGRNQKRAFREKVAALDHEKNLLNLQNKRTIERFHEIENYANRINEIIGGATIISRDIDVHKTGYEMDYLNKIVLKEMDLQAFLRDGPYTGQCINQKVLQVIKIKAVQDKVRECMHVRLTCGNSVYGYAITPEAIKLLPLRQLAENISLQMAIAIKEGLDK